LTGSIRAVLPVAFLSVQDLTSTAGGLAAAIAIGAFIGQVFAVAAAATDEGRREAIATGGLIGLLAMIGLILLSAKWG
jgi:ABC-type arginine transport system permease subunit